MKKSGLLERHVVWVPKFLKRLIHKSCIYSRLYIENAASTKKKEIEAKPPRKLEIWVLTPELAAEIRKKI